MSIQITPIGYVSTQAENVPPFYTISDVKGKIVIDDKYKIGIQDIQPGSEILVVFQFHKSPEFSENHLRIIPRGGGRKVGIFSTRSPVRPNPIGVSVLIVTAVKGNTLTVKNLDMLDGTPVLDIKPVVT